MNQILIGKFKAELQKEKKLTQAELGELPGVTNKTVSRWENGNYMPDLSVMQNLCEILDISINELISLTMIGISWYRKSKYDKHVLKRVQQLKNHP